MSIDDIGPRPQAFDLEAETLENPNYRTVAWSGRYLQVTLMSIPVNGDIGLEKHPDTDQFIRLDRGRGRAQMGPAKDELTFDHEVSDGWCVIVPAGSWHNITNIGDEPMQFHGKFPDIAVAVGEERIVAIPQLLHDRPETRAIILDDAFQHRTVRAGLNVLLTDYSNLFTRDWWLPSGDLRDAPSSCRRADIIVVTKCPEDLTEESRRAIAIEIGPLAHQQLFFSSIRYGTPYHITRGIAARQDKPANGKTPAATAAVDGPLRGAVSKAAPGTTAVSAAPGMTAVIDDKVEVLLVTGIANPAPLKQWLDQHSRTYYEIAYGDHHIFTIDDLQTILRRFDGIAAEKKLILTTEKDAVRLIKFRQELEGWPFYVLPITPGFLFGEEDRFTELITTFINDFHVPENVRDRRGPGRRPGSIKQTNDEK